MSKASQRRWSCGERLLMFQYWPLAGTGMATLESRAVFGLGGVVSGFTKRSSPVSMDMIFSQCAEPRRGTGVPIYEAACPVWRRFIDTWQPVRTNLLNPCTVARAYLRLHSQELACLVPASLSLDEESMLNESEWHVEPSSLTKRHRKRADNVDHHSPWS